MRTITAILGNSQRLDGGAMFGNAPKAMWSKWVDVDANNCIALACRAMLITETTQHADGRTLHRRILCETGIGAFFPPKLKDRYGVVESTHVLLASLQTMGLSDADIDVVVLSHLHFDHAGGLLSAYQENTPPQLLFPNARFVCSQAAWERACHPHPRDRASFIPELQPLLAQSGRLECVTGTTSTTLGDGYRFHLSEGHTPGLLLTEVAMPDGPVVFAGDLIPGAAWVHVPITMGYDRFPERVIDEKQQLLQYIVTHGGKLFYTHDPVYAMSRITQDERGRFSAIDAC